ncbi:MAG: DUF2225 domain-containing protein [Candidatus Heimdallarchaeota archaeon]
MPLLYDEMFTCHNCGIIFQTKILGCYNTFGKRYSDLYIASEDDPQPILYQICKCPKCGFAGFTDEYRMLSLEEEEMAMAIKAAEDFTGKKAQEFNQGDGFIVVAKYSESHSLEEQVSLYLQASYAYRELKDPLLQKARTIVLELLEKIIEKKEFTFQSEEYYCYLAGEIARLLGENEKSLKYFKRALQVAPENSLVSKLTQHQLVHPSEVIRAEIFSHKIC